MMIRGTGRLRVVALLTATICGACLPDELPQWVAYELAVVDAELASAPLARENDTIQLAGTEWRWEHTQYGFHATAFNRSGEILEIDCTGGTFVDEHGDEHPLQCVDGAVAYEIDETELITGPVSVAPGARRTLGFVAGDYTEGWRGGKRRVLSLLPSDTHRLICCHGRSRSELEPVARANAHATLGLVIPVRPESRETRALRVRFAVVSTGIRSFY